MFILIIIKKKLDYKKLLEKQSTMFSSTSGGMNFNFDANLSHNIFGSTSNFGFNTFGS